MLSVGDRFPEFSLKAAGAGEGLKALHDLSSADFKSKWLVAFFYPKDFTFVCPTEILGFASLNSDFEERGAKVIGVSTDSEFVHMAWRQSRDDFASLPFPLVSDIRRDLSEALGILEDSEKICNRATYIVDPDGVIQYAAMTAGSVGRNPAEVLRILDALQTGELCPASWAKGQDTITL